MAASREDIRGWLARGMAAGCTHLIVVCDEFDYEDYPVYVSRGEDAKAIVKEYGKKDMQHVMEVYNLSMDIHKQLGEHRAFHF